MGSCFSSTAEPPPRVHAQHYYPEQQKQVYAEPVYPQAVMYQQQQQPTVMYQQQPMVMYQQQPVMYQQQPMVYHQQPVMYQQQPQMSAGTAFVGGMLAGAVLEDILE